MATFADTIKYLKDQQTFDDYTTMNSSSNHLHLLASLLSEPANSQVSSFRGIMAQPPCTDLERLFTQQAAAVSTTSLLDTPVGVAALAAATAAPAGPRVAAAALSERERFLIFVKVLFKYIERLNSPSLRTRAKAVIAECTQRNRMGIPGYTPLMSSVERRLKQSLGELHWARAQLCFHTYLRKTTARSLNATAIQGV